jgi:hypothetical protein
MAVPTVGGVTLDNVSSIAYTKDGNIIPLPLPGSDSDGTETWDMLGVTKILTLTGFYIGATATVKASIDSIANLVNGDQSSSVSLITDEIGTISVKIASLDVVWDTLNNKAQYTIKMIEGT